MGARILLKAKGIKTKPRFPEKGYRGFFIGRLEPAFFRQFLEMFLEVGGSDTRYPAPLLVLLGKKGTEGLKVNPSVPFL